MASRYEKRTSNGSNGSVNSPRFGSGSMALADAEVSPMLLAGLNKNNNNTVSSKSKVDTHLMNDGEEDEVFVRHLDQAPLVKRSSRKSGHRGYGNASADDSEHLLHGSDSDEKFDKLNEADYAFSRSHANRVRSAWKSRARRSICACTILLVIFGALVGGTIYALKRLNAENNLAILDATAMKLDESRGCDDLQVEDVWTVGFPKLATESAFRLLDANGDGVLDVVFGYGTAADNLETEPLYCAIYFDDKSPCFGGVRCLDGRDGRVLWDARTDHEVYALNCAADLDGDSVLDCVAAGRGSIFAAVSGRNGSIIWRFGKEKDAAKSSGKSTQSPSRSEGVDEDGEKEELVRFSNMYTATIVGDVDQDGVLDFAQVHGGDPLADPSAPRTLAAALLLISGRTGRLLQSVSVPDHTESYSSPQMLMLDDGLPALVYGTGGETHGGSLWRVKLADLIDGRAEQRSLPLATDGSKGWMTPCAFVDITMDNVVDLVCVAFNATVYAIDGRTWRTIWTFTEALGESYATPAVGYFNNDAVPDIAVQFNVGDGFPIYYFSVTLLLDGRTGRPLSSPFKPVYSLVATQTSPLSISLDGHGNDLLVFWSATCTSVDSDGSFKHDAPTVATVSDGLYVDGMSDEEMRRRFIDGRRMQFLKGTEASAQSRIDFCAQRFDNTTRTRPRSFAFVSGAALHGGRAVLYDEASRDAVEHRWMADTHAELLSWLQRNPHYRNYYEQYAAEVRRIQQVDAVDATAPGNDVETPTKDESSSNSKPRKLDSNKKTNPDTDTDTDTEQTGTRGNTAGAKQQKGNDYEDAPRTHQSASNNRGKYSRTNARANDEEAEEPEEADEAAMKDEPVARRVDRTRSAVSQSRSTADKASSRSVPDRKSGASQLSDTDSDSGAGASTDAEPDDETRSQSKSKPAGNTSRKKQAADTGASSQSTSSYDNLANALEAGFTDQNDGEPNAQPSAANGGKSSVKTGSGSTGQSSSSSFRREPGRPRRARRHVGTHDGDGLQRLISTGTLAPSLVNTNGNGNDTDSSSIDYVFATYWFPPRRATLLYADEQRCVDELLAQEATLRSKPPFRGMDHDRFVHAVAKKCLEQSSHGPDRATKLQIDAANPFELASGQLTIYRVRISCKCKAAPTPTSTSTSAGGRCARILPFDQQRWAAYLGTHGDSLFRP